MSVARRVSLLLSIVAVAACAGHAPRPSTAGSYDSGPLAARLLPPDHRTLGFVLSEPAYVTIFEIVPGRGVSVVYPAPFDEGARRPLGAGSHAVFAVPYNVGRWYYSDAPVAASGPTFLYMIASREPLPVDEVLRNPASLRRTVGFASFTQSNEQRTMDALDERFVPRHLDDDAWTSDWIALWPEPALDRPPVDASLLVPRCADGMVVVAIPGPTPAFVCAPRNTKQPPPAPSEPTPPDTAPTPRRPPAEAKPTTPPHGRRPSAPKQTRAEPMSLAVDYGTPLTLSSLEERPSRQRASHRYERPWERSDRASGHAPSAGEGRRDGYETRSPRGVPESAERAERSAAPSHASTPRAEPRTEPRSEPAAAPSAPRSTRGGQ